MVRLTHPGKHISAVVVVVVVDVVVVVAVVVVFVVVIDVGVVVVGTVRSVKLSFTRMRRPHWIL